MARRDDLAKLRGLAGERGLSIEKAYRRNCWRLVDGTGKAITNPRDGSVAFTVAAATAFLEDRKPKPETYRGGSGKRR